MADCLVALGSNLGTREALLDQAVDLLGQIPQTTVRKASSYHETQPIGGPGEQEPFLNAAVRLTTELAPLHLLTETQRIEQTLGRTRDVRWGPRTIDIDILLYDSLVLRTPDLTLPHPRMAVRRFVLEPANEVAADMPYAGTQFDVSLMLKRLHNPTLYIAVCCADPEESRRLVRAAGERLAAHVMHGPACRARPSETISSEAVLQQAGEVMHQQLQLFQQESSSPLLISDFWLGEYRALARTWPFRSEQVQLHSLCRSHLKRTLEPTFILHLNMTGRVETPSEETHPWSSWSDVQNEPPPIAWYRAVTCFHRAPTLDVPAGDPQAALTELLAAVDAMR